MYAYFNSDYVHLLDKLGHWLTATIDRFQTDNQGFTPYVCIIPLEKRTYRKAYMADGRIGEYL